AHRQAAGNDRVAALAELVERDLDACVPVVPVGREQVALVAAVAGELRAMHREALACEPLGDELQLERRAAEPVGEQEAGAAVADGEAGVGADHARLTRAKSWSSSAIARSISAKLMVSDGAKVMTFLW